MQQDSEYVPDRARLGLLAFGAERNFTGEALHRVLFEAELNESSRLLVFLKIKTCKVLVAQFGRDRNRFDTLQHVVGAFGPVIRVGFHTMYDQIIEACRDIWIDRGGT